MQSTFYVEEIDGLYNLRSRRFSCSSYEKALELFNQLKVDFRKEVDPIMDCLTEEELYPGYLVIGDGEDRYELILWFRLVGFLSAVVVLGATILLNVGMLCVDWFPRRALAICWASVLS